MKRLGDLVHSSIVASHRVVHFGLSSDAAHLANDKSVTNVIKHLDRGSDHVLLRFERLPEHVVEIG